MTTLKRSKFAAALIGAAIVTSGCVHPRHPPKPTTTASTTRPTTVTTMRPTTTRLTTGTTRCPVIGTIVPGYPPPPPYPCGTPTTVTTR